MQQLNTTHRNPLETMPFSFKMATILTRSQAVARIADRTAKNSMGHVT